MLDIELYNVWRHDKEMIKEKPGWKILIIKTRQSGWKIQVWKTMIWLGFCTELITVALHYYIFNALQKFFWAQLHSFTLMVHNCYFNEILHLQWCSFGISRLSLISRRLFGFYQMSSTITMPIGGWLQTFNDFFCFTFSLKPNLCLQVKLFLLIIVKLRVCNFVIFS